MTLTQQQLTLMYILSCLKQIEFNDYKACLDQWRKFVANMHYLPELLLNNIQEHVKKITKIIESSKSEEKKMSKMEKQLLDIEIIFGKHGIA